MTDKPSQGQPKGWTPKTELEHFMQCPVCQKFFDMRDLSAALDHWHDGPDQARTSQRPRAL